MYEKRNRKAVGPVLFRMHGISDQRDHEIRFEGEFTSLNLLLAVLHQISSTDEIESHIILVFQKYFI